MVSRDEPVANHYPKRGHKNSHGIHRNLGPSSSGSRVSLIYKNGVAIYDGGQITQGVATLPNIISGATGWVDCVAGDYFELGIRQNSGANLIPEFTGMHLNVELK